MACALILIVSLEPTMSVGRHDLDPDQNYDDCLVLSCLTQQIFCHLQALLRFLVSGSISSVACKRSLGGLLFRVSHCDIM